MGPVSACAELLGHLTMAVPWAAAIEEKVRDLDVRFKNVKQVEVEADALRVEVRALTRRVDALEQEKITLEQDREAAIALAGRRTQRLRAARKSEKKTKKLLLRTEDRCTDLGYEMAVIKVHELGLDHKLLLDEGADDPLERQGDLDEPLVASSDPESELSD